MKGILAMTIPTLFLMQKIYGSYISKRFHVIVRNIWLLFRAGQQTQKTQSKQVTYKCTLITDSILDQ